MQINPNPTTIEPVNVGLLNIAKRMIPTPNVINTIPVRNLFVVLVLSIFKQISLFSYVLERNAQSVNIIP